MYKQAITNLKNSGLKKIIRLHSGNLLKSLSSFIDHKYTEITYFSYKRLLLPTLILTGHFYFLYLFFPQTASSPYFLPALTLALTFKFKLLIVSNLKEKNCRL